MRILLVQLAGSGDCLLATTIARQIKEVDYPACHLTWLIGSAHRAVIWNNPYVDSVIEVPIDSWAEIQPQRELIQEHVDKLAKTDQFDRVFITDYTADNAQKWFGTTRSSLFRSYPHKLSVNVAPVIVLTDEEVNHVREFADEHALEKGEFTILFECSPQSGQSNMTLGRAHHIAEEVVGRFPQVKVILSSGTRVVSQKPNIIDGSRITWRENAELTRYCHLLVGSSSGISWLNTSTGGAGLPMIQNINPYYAQTRFTASVEIDFRYFGMSTSEILEMANANDDEMIRCVTAVLERGFAYARKKYHMRHRVYYGGRAFLTDVLRTGSYQRGNLSNLGLVLFLLRCEVYSRLSPKSVVRKLYRYAKDVSGHSE
jgi:hypothetical protein